MSSLSRHTDRASFAYEDIELTLNGELATRIEASEQRIAHAHNTKGQDDRLGQKPQVARLEEEHEALLDEIADDIFALRIRAVSRTKWATIITNAPARRGNDVDRIVQADADAVTVAVVEHSGRLIEDGKEVRPDDAEWPAFWEALSPGQFGKLRDIVWRVNSGHTDVSGLKKG